MKYRASYNRAQRGTASVDVSAAVSGFVDVTFPVPFAAAPVVVATTGSDTYFASVNNVTATGFRLTVRQIDGTSGTTTVTAYWIAEP